MAALRGGDGPQWVDFCRMQSGRRQRLWSAHRRTVCGQHRPLARAVTRTFERRLRADNGPSCASVFTDGPVSRAMGSQHRDVDASKGRRDQRNRWRPFGWKGLGRSSVSAISHFTTYETPMMTMLPANIWDRACGPVARRVIPGVSVSLQNAFRKDV